MPGAADLQFPGNGRASIAGDGACEREVRSRHHACAVPQAINDVAEGHVSLSMAEVGASLGLICEGKVRALAVTLTQRLSAHPTVLPFVEAANVPDFEVVSWQILLAPPKTPRRIVDKLHAEVKHIMSDKEMQDKLVGLGLIPLSPPSIEDTRTYVGSETAKRSELVKKVELAG